MSLVIIASLLLGPSLGDLVDARDMRQFENLPPAVHAFVERRVACNYWSGEQGGLDRDRQREVAERLDRLNCRRLDTEERRLRRRYQHSPGTLKAIAAARELPG